MKITIDFEYPDTIYMSDIPRFDSRFKDVIKELLYTNGVDKVDKSIEGAVINYEKCIFNK